MTQAKTKPDDQPTAEEAQSDDTVREEKERQPYKDVDGNVIDAPTIPSFERELQDAQNRADVNAIDEITARYHKARDEKVKDDNKREKDRRKQDN